MAGKWTLVEDGDAYTLGYDAWACDVFDDDADPGSKLVASAHGRSRKEVLQRARLIAKAPEMVEALRACEWAACLGEVLATDETERRRCSEAVDQARALLAEIEGGE